MDTVRGRFAPSPTGAIHLGNVWTALLAWLDARQRGGVFVLRIEDLDPDRSKGHLAEHLLADLRWLGLDWDEGPDVGGSYAPYTQNERRQLYDHALHTLAERDLVYRCYCTRAEIHAAAASAPHGTEPRLHCANRCWQSTAREQQARAAAGRQLALRVRTPQEPIPIDFTDACCGDVAEDVAQAAGDFVVQRADGVHAYHLAVVVDDGAMHITHVVRGADLLGSTARQIWLHKQLGSTPPQWAHVPLLVGPDEHRLSKRHASLAIAALRAHGVSAETIIGRLAHIGGLLDVPTAAQPRELIGLLRLDRLTRGSIMVDPAAFA